MQDAVMKSMLSEYAGYALQGIMHIIPDKEPKKYLYDLIADYPTRGGKGFRPGLCIATCRAFGGRLDQALNSATALELFHNAFLVHDDVEDVSYVRRNKPTMHQYNNMGIAVNVGDAMNVLSLKPLLKNKEVLGPALAMKIFEEIEHMVAETVEGQAIELGWRKDNVCRLDDADYMRMILKKTCWYTCIHPVRIGAMIGSCGKVAVDKFNRFGYFMGTAFQIQDDILNLVAEENKYGKEIGGDIIEGKRTLMLIHLFKTCNKKELEKLALFLSDTQADGNHEIAAWIMRLMDKYGSIDHCRKVAKYMAGAALKEFCSVFAALPDSKDKKFIEELIVYMINRDY
ncbi:polyprenyl synthetase family protein [Danxiaibacter flavus]|uniref:Polyprenyl synthetase family protein n=1 Tax=Danxiaibacter flavus TaxID=3049108 RepID=A0ABV3ZC57_9BACT|nr:polyprenyl synthetase family protein [Chitinophagaceae bacterium DXS]